MPSMTDILKLIKMVYSLKDIAGIGMNILLMYLFDKELVSIYKNNSYN